MTMPPNTLPETLSNGLPQPPIPKELHESLLPYPECITRLLQALVIHIDDLRGKQVDFNKAYFDLQTVMAEQATIFLVEAEGEYKLARIAGNDVKAKLAGKKYEIMSLWTYYHEIGSTTELVDYIEKYKEELEIKTINY